MKSMITLVAGALCGFAAYAYDSSSYVQNWLIAQWDGIDNQGTGTHDPTATTWKDLKGSLDMTLTAKGSWTADGNALVRHWRGCAGRERDTSLQDHRNRLQDDIGRRAHSVHERNSIEIRRFRPGGRRPQQKTLFRDRKSVV